MPHILIICTANICRSPLVEALVRRKLTEQGYDDWVVSSAGTWAQLERGAANGSLRVGKTMGLDFEDHVARMVTDEIISEVDLVVCMTANHKEALQLDFKDSADIIYKLSEMVGKSYDITDPYGGPYDGYVEMGQEVARLVEDGMPRIIELASAGAAQRL